MMVFAILEHIFAHLSFLIISIVITIHMTLLIHEIIGYVIHQKCECVCVCTYLTLDLEHIISIVIMIHLMTLLTTKL